MLVRYRPYVAQSNLTVNDKPIFMVLVIYSVRCLKCDSNHQQKTEKKEGKEKLSRFLIFARCCWCFVVAKSFWMNFYSFCLPRMTNMKIVLRQLIFTYFLLLFLFSFFLFLFQLPPQLWKWAWYTRQYVYLIT